MLREALVGLALSMALVASVPLAPALPATCDVVAYVEESVQNDAGSAGDAGDTPLDARRVGHDGDYAGYLSLVGHSRADREDWYVYHIPEGIDLMRANVTRAYPAIPLYVVSPPAYVHGFMLTVYPPAGEPRSITSEEGTLLLPEPAPGDYLVRVTATGIVEAPDCTGLPPSGSTDAASPLARNHAMYLGCDPLCAATV